MSRNQQQTSRPAAMLVGTVTLGIIALVISFFTWAFFMHSETVEPGHHLVINDKPYFFGNEGVRDKPLTAGRILLFATSDGVPVRMTNQSVQVKFDDLMTSDMFMLDFDSTIQYRFTDAVRLVRDFGAETWFTANVERQYMAIVRDVVKQYTMTKIVSDASTAADVDNEITKLLQDHVIQGKLPLEVLSISLGRAKPNTEVMAQMNKTSAEKERKKTLVEAEAAEIQRAKEQVAKANADNAYRNAMNMSPEQFIQLEQINKYSAACQVSKNCIFTSGQMPVVIGK